MSSYDEDDVRDLRGLGHGQSLWGQSDTTPKLTPVCKSWCGIRGWTVDVNDEWWCDENGQGYCSPACRDAGGPQRAVPNAGELWILGACGCVGKANGTSRPGFAEAKRQIYGLDMPVVCLTREVHDYIVPWLIGVRRIG